MNAHLIYCLKFELDKILTFISFHFHRYINCLMSGTLFFNASSINNNMVVYWWLIAIGNYGGFFVDLMLVELQEVYHMRFVIDVFVKLLFPCLSLLDLHTNPLFRSVRLKLLFVYFAQLTSVQLIAIDRGCCGSCSVAS